MEGGLNESVMQMVVIIIVTVVLGIVLVVVQTTKGRSDDWSKEIENGTSGVAASEIRTIESYGEPIPATSLFIACTKNEKNIEEVSGVVDGVVISDVDDLARVFHCQVMCNITETSPDKFKIKVGD